MSAPRMLLLKPFYVAFGLDILTLHITVYSRNKEILFVDYAVKWSQRTNVFFIQKTRKTKEKAFDGIFDTFLTT